MTSLSRALSLVVCCLLAACAKNEEAPGSAASARPAATTAAVKPTATASADATADAPKARKLDPLPLTLELPASAKIDTSPTGGSMITDGAAKFSVGKLDKGFAGEKKFLETFPLDTFKKWVKNEKTLAIAEFGTGTPNYRALMEIEVGGQKYFCQNVGIPGAPSADEAEAVVKRCLGLKPAP